IPQERTVDAAMCGVADDFVERVDAVSLAVSVPWQGSEVAPAHSVPVCGVRVVADDRLSGDVSKAVDRGAEVRAALRQRSKIRHPAAIEYERVRRAVAAVGEPSDLTHSVDGSRHHEATARQSSRYRCYRGSSGEIATRVWQTIGVPLANEHALVHAKHRHE